MPFANDRIRPTTVPPAPTFAQGRHPFILVLILACALLFAATPAFAARTINSATLNSVTVTPGATISATVSVTTSGLLGLDTNWNCTRWRIDTGPWTNVNHGNHSGSGTYSETFNITAPGNPGTYSVSFIAHSNNDCDSGASNTYTLSNAITVPAVNCTSNNTGNWNNANTWTNCRGGIPLQGDSVTINSHTVTIDTSPTIASFTNSGTLSQNGTRTLTVTGDFNNHATVNAGNLTLNVGGNTAINGALTAASLNLGGNTTINIGPLTAASLNASGDVTANNAALAIANLVMQKTGTQALVLYGGNNNITNLTINAGTTVSSAAYSQINLKGNLTNNGTLVLPNTTLTINGTAAQTIGGGSDSTLGNLIMNNAAGLTLGRNVTVRGVLTLTNGTVTTGSYVLTSANEICSGAISGGSASSYVNGNLRLTYPNWNVTCTYPVGSGGAYIPLRVTIPWFSGISGGTLTGSTASGDHPQISTAGIDRNRNANRHWTLGMAGDTMTTLPANGSYTVELPFVAADLDAGAPVADFKGAAYTASGWSALAGSTSGNTTTFPGGRYFGSYAVGPAAVPFCSPPSNAPAGATLTCVCDMFDRSSLNPSPIYGANWIVSNSDGTGVNPSIVSQNYLRLTPNSANQAKAATVPGVFPAAGNYISVEFKHYAYNGSGADGIAVTLSDYSVPVVPGGFGGSLGYAQRNDSNPAPPGFAGGWVGVALDEYGNYQNPTEGRILGPGSRSQSVGVRGPGSGGNGYRWIGGTASRSGNMDIDARTSTAPAPGYMYQIIVDARNVAGGQALIHVNRDHTAKDGTSYVNLFGGAGGFNAYTEANYALSQGWITKIVPDYWKISFTGSTGGANNIHEIGSLRICAQTVYPPDNFGGTASGFNAIDEAHPFPATTAQWQYYQSGHIYTKLAGVPFKLNVAALGPSGIKTDYVASGTKNVTLKLVDNSDGVCQIDSSKPNYCSAACNNKSAVSGGSQTLGFTTGDKGQRQSANFTLAAAYKNLVAIMDDGSTSACSTDAFSVRPAAFTAVSSTGATNGKLKAGTDAFDLAVVANAPGYLGRPRLNRSVITATDTAGGVGVTGEFVPARFPAAAVSGQPTATQSRAFADTFKYGEAGTFKLKGGADTAAIGVYDGIVSASDCPSPMTGADCNLLRADTWTGIDAPTTIADCIADSFSNAKSATGTYANNPNYGKYGCNVGLSADSAAFGRFTPDHFILLDASLCDGLAGSLIQTRAIGATAAGATVLTVKDASCLVPGMTVAIAGAGAGGAVLNTQITQVAGNAITLQSATGAAFTEAVVTGPAVPGILSYMGQGMGLGVGLEALNGSGNRTRNYTGVNLPLGFVAEDQGTPGTDRSVRLGGLPAQAACVNGYCAAQTAAARFDRAASPDGPFKLLDIGVRATDGDGIGLAGFDMNPEKEGTSGTAPNLVDACVATAGTCTARRIGRVETRFGRLRLVGAHGSELLPLRVEGRAEYWNGSGWVLNADDAATAFPGVGMTAGGGIAANTCFLANPPPASPANDDCLAAAPPVTMSGGRGAWVVFDKTPTQAGFADLTLVVPAWLQGHWSGAASGHTENPVARVRFGSPKAPYIYLRERY